MSATLIIATWLVVANVVTFFAFGADKRLAEAGAWRISENTLLLLAIIGGTIGAIAASRYFRHKTRKEPFRSTLRNIAALQVIALLVWLIKPDLIASLADLAWLYIDRP